MQDLQRELKGILLSGVIGLSAYYLSPHLPSTFNSILLALLMGILAGNFISIPESFQSGIGFTGSKLLEISILFLAFDINYRHIASLGLGSFSLIGVMILSMLLLTYFLSRKIKCPGTTGWLIGFGTAICGSSAIAALAPGVTKEKNEIGIAMAVVNLFGTLGMILLPAVLEPLQLSIRELGLIIGGSLHSVGNVVGAGYSMGKEVGEAAITIKLARVALLLPALLFFNYLLNRKEGKSGKSFFSLPWYLWSFIGITLMSSIFSFPPEFLALMETGGKIILTVAMAAIGLKVSFRQLLQSGKMGISFGFLLFVIQLGLLGIFVLVV